MLAFLAATSPALAAPAKDELTFSAALANPNKGDTSWAATGEYLIGVGSTFVFGPSIGLFDTGTLNGGAIGVAGEVAVGKTSGLFLGGALHKLTGDAADAADYTAEARAGLKFGTERGGVKVYASQVWSRDKAGAVTDPAGTQVTAGVFLRF
jgi:hypothetical protein